MSEPTRPPPPVVGKVTHHSAELYWTEAFEKASEESNQSGGGRVRVCVQEEDRSGTWGNVYTGYSKSYVLEGLEEITQYKYRIRFMNDHGASPWSAVMTMSTTREPLSGEHLHRAINRNDAEEVKRILETGEVLVDVPDKFGHTPLMQASKLGLVEDVGVEVADKYGFFPLMVAAQKGLLEICDLLIGYEADVNNANDSGKTALMLACFSGHLEVVKLLRSHGAEYTAKDKGGSCPIHWAVDGGDLELIEWIINDGADVNMKDYHSQWTPLLRAACVGGNADVAELLLRCGAEIDARDRDGKTALMIAVINGQQKLVELLLEKRADLNVKNEYGKNAYEMALSLEKRKIVKVLEAHFERNGIKMRYS